VRSLQSVGNFAVFIVNSVKFASCQYCSSGNFSRFFPIRIELRMEQLSPEVRQKVVKMSDGRLRQKLVQAGYREVDIATLDWASLLEYYAKVVLAETAYVPAKEEQGEDED